MSLSDYIRYQRAAKGGLTPWEIAEGSGVSSRDVHLIEVKHRRMGDDDEMLRKLAAYFGVPFDALASRREAYRKRLAAFLDHNVSQSRPINLKLESGEELAGVPIWYSREAVALREVPPRLRPETTPLTCASSSAAGWPIGKSQMPRRGK